MGSGAKLVRKKRSLRTVVQGYEHKKCLLAGYSVNTGALPQSGVRYHLIADRKIYVVIVNCVLQTRNAVEFESPLGIS
jgi:hypothetical protein